MARMAIQESLSYEEFLLEVLTREVDSRRTNRITRYLKVSKLPLDKTFQTFEIKRLTKKLLQQTKVLQK